MLNSLLQLVLTTLSIQAIPPASAETLVEPNWPEKQALVIEEEQPAPFLVQGYPSKEDLFALSPEGDLFWVVAVLDGDTLLLSAPDRSLFQVRLLAVDTNEINGPDSTAECYGPEAALFTMQFLANRAVRLSADPANEDLDPYGRKLRYVDVLQEDGSFTRLNDILLQEGYATFPTQYPVSTPDYFKALETEAQNQAKGLWSAC